jgi:hypothetical protein
LHPLLGYNFGFLDFFVSTKRKKKCTADQASGIKRSWKKSRSFLRCSMFALLTSPGILKISSSSIFFSKSIMWDAFSDLMTQEKNTEKPNENEY